MNSKIILTFADKLQAVDMRKYFFIGLGCTTGFFLMIVLLSVFSVFSVDNNKEDNLKVQYFDVTTRKGTFTLHTAMPKDSVRLVIGKPDETDVVDMGSCVQETYTYKGKGYKMLCITFEDGILTRVDNF